ncbi:hypothetical protein PCE1_004429 [Barthelona sp. PCE]
MYEINKKKFIAVVMAHRGLGLQQLQSKKASIAKKLKITLEKAEYLIKNISRHLNVVEIEELFSVLCNGTHLVLKKKEKQNPVEVVSAPQKYKQKSKAKHKPKTKLKPRNKPNIMKCCLCKNALSTTVFLHKKSLHDPICTVCVKKFPPERQKQLIGKRNPHTKKKSSKLQKKPLVCVSPNDINLILHAVAQCNFSVNLIQFHTKLPEDKILRILELLFAIEFPLTMWEAEMQKKQSQYPKYLSRMVQSKAEHTVKITFEGDQNDAEIYRDLRTIKTLARNIATSDKEARLWENVVRSTENYAKKSSHAGIFNLKLYHSYKKFAVEKGERRIPFRITETWHPSPKPKMKQNPLQIKITPKRKKKIRDGKTTRYFTCDAEMHITLRKRKAWPYSSTPLKSQRIDLKNFE